MSALTSAGGVMRWSRLEWFGLLLIVGLAATLRFAALDRLPPGLYHDEAFNGLDALRVLGGQTPIFFEANNGREPLFIYLAAASVALWGRSPGALRLVSALIGTLTVAAVYWLGRELYGRRIAFIAALLAATAVWTLTLSRVAFRAVTMPPLQAVALALLWRGLRTRRVAAIFGAGISMGFTFYTYLAARFGLLALLLFLFYVLLWQRELLWWRGWMIFGLLGLLVAAPLGFYFASHWSATLGRAGQVSIWNPAVNGGDLWGTLLRQTWRTALSFFYRGDFIPRHNVPLRPIFDPLIAVAFLGGVILAARQAGRRAGGVLCLVWLGVMALPTILAEGAPHMLRATGMLPVLFILPALGLAEAWRFLSARGLARVGAALLGVVLLMSAGLNVTAYAVHLHSEALYYNLEGGASDMAADINRFLGWGWPGYGLVGGSAAEPPSLETTGQRVVLAPRLWRDWASLRYLCPAQEALVVYSPNDSVPPPASDEGDVLMVLWPFEDNSAALALLPRDRLLAVREGARERGDLEQDSRLLYVSFRTLPLKEAPRQAMVAWEKGITLLGYHLEHLDESHLLVSLYWQATAPLEESYTVFCHVLSGGTPIGQHDGLPAQGYYPTVAWRPGDVIEDRHLVSLSAAYGQDAQVIVGLYRWETMQRLRRVNSAGQPTEQTTLALP